MHIQQDGQSKTWYVTLRTVECTWGQVKEVVEGLPEVPTEEPVALSESVSAKKKGEEQGWSVNFTFKGFPDIDAVKDFLKAFPKELATATGQKTLDSVV